VILEGQTDLLDQLADGVDVHRRSALGKGTNPPQSFGEDLLGSGALSCHSGSISALSTSS